MTTTVPEPLLAQRSGLAEAFDAAARARSARRAGDEAARLVGALADRRAAADSAVRDAQRRVAAVRVLRPSWFLLVLTGRLVAERGRRRAALAAAVADRDAVVAKVRAYQKESAGLHQAADAAAAQAAALPRLLDEVALLVRAAGGDGAARLAACEAAIGPLLVEDAVLTQAIRAADPAEEPGLRELRADVRHRLAAARAERVAVLRGEG